MTVYTTYVEEDENGELLITIPQPILDELNWGEGTTVEWLDNKDGTWSLRKVKEPDNQTPDMTQSS